MGYFRFRRSMKIGPGVRWNFGKKSTSFSLGPRGLKLTAGTRGVRTTVGIPGTGISYTSTTHASGLAHATHAGRVPSASIRRPTSVTPTAVFGVLALLALLVGANGAALLWLLLAGCSFAISRISERQIEELPVAPPERKEIQPGRDRPQRGQ